MSKELFCHLKDYFFAAAVSPRMQASGDFSAAVPFLKRPSNLDGTYAGDVGFDPLVSSCAKRMHVEHGFVCSSVT
jgi:hypothetical protein